MPTPTPAPQPPSPVAALDQKRGALPCRPARFAFADNAVVAALAGAGLWGGTDFVLATWFVLLAGTLRRFGPWRDDRGTVPAFLPSGAAPR